MRVVVADPSEMIRRMLRRAFARAPGMDLVADTPCGVRALELVEEFHPDAVVTEADLATIDGAELIRRLRGAHPEVLVVAFTSHGDADRELMAAGADRFLMKGGDTRKLFEALRGV